ncbi:MAG: hydrogenase expression/formation protein HypE [Desulfobacteraceae bacterium]|jgi:hydrogenase expression/formation protein HypE
MNHSTNEKIVLDHGTGAKLSHELVSLIAEKLGDQHIGEMEDSAVLKVPVDHIAFTTDSFVVTPIFFGNGDIGKIAVCGTVNDLAVSGATPQYLSLSLVLEEGLDMNDLLRIIESIRKAAEEANVKIAAGDTKVVGKGEVDKIIINTSGIGYFIHKPLSQYNLEPGDKVILSGQIGNHSIHILCARVNLSDSIQQRVVSDCAPLNGMIHELLENLPTGSISSIRDVTRGGLCAVLNEFAKSSGKSIYFKQNKLPISYDTKMASDMLGLNPIHLANEGCICLFVKPQFEERVLKLLKNHKYGQHAVTIGYISEDNSRNVVMFSSDGSKQIIEELSGRELPRLC